MKTEKYLTSWIAKRVQIGVLKYYLLVAVVIHQTKAHKVMQMDG